MTAPIVPIVTFFNNKGGVGKTSLVYHVAWMLADLGHRVVAADLDPQANLTSAFLDEDQLERVWPLDQEHHSIWGAIRPFHEGEGPLGRAPLARTGDDRLVLLPGDLTLASFEDRRIRRARTGRTVPPGPGVPEVAGPDSGAVSNIRA